MRELVSILNGWYQEYKQRIQLIMVYTLEAHAHDEWKIGSQFQYDQPVVLAERYAIVQDFIGYTKIQIPIYLDTLPKRVLRNQNETNLFNQAYNAWPIRAYVIHEKVLKFISEPTDQGHFIPGQVIDCLNIIWNL